MKHKFILFALVLLLAALIVQPAAAYRTEPGSQPPGPSYPLIDGLPSTSPTPAPVTGGSLGPNLNDFPPGVNPLTGLPVTNPAGLQLPAVLVSLSNFPPSVRPQTGLSFAPQVYEIYITEGMTRFLTVFYGDLPAPSQTTPASTTGAAVPMEGSTWGIEGVRSGREAYVPITSAFPNGCLVAASKSSAVNINICRNVYGSNPGDINSAGLTFDQLTDLAKANQDPAAPPNYSGNLFDPIPPAGGQPAAQLNVFYAWLNQAQWIYDPAAQTYLRYEDFGTPDQAGQFRPAIDRLTGDPVDFENVVILFVEHIARTPTIIDLNMGVGTQGRAVALRNGQIYTGLTWSMLNESYERTTGLARPLRLRTAEGDPFPLTPGHTWFHVATTTSAVWPLDESAGIWKYRYDPPPGAQ